MFALLLAIWKTPAGEYLRGELDPKVREQGHFGPTLKTYILYQYYHCHVTQPLLLEQLREWEIDISSGQLNQIIANCKKSRDLGGGSIGEPQLLPLTVQFDRFEDG